VPLVEPESIVRTGTWPNFFIAGAPKAGTSSLHAYLQAVPGIFMSRIKEPNYFSRGIIADDHRSRPIRDTAKYLQLFAGAAGARIIGEASPTYLADPEAPGLIRQVSPDSRVLISLRDPVERAFSHYLMMRNNGTAKASFLEEFRRGLELQAQRSLPLLRPELGLYHAQVQRYLQIFGPAQVKVILFEEFMADARGTLAQILEFLGIDHDLAGFEAKAYRQFAEVRSPVVRYLFGNRTIARASEILVPPRLRRWVRETFLVRSAQKPAMEPEAREFLIRYYREDVRNLAALLGRPLPWRNFTESPMGERR
jgi:hypothetical protein